MPRLLLHSYLLSAFNGDSAVMFYLRCFFSWQCQCQNAVFIFYLTISAVKKEEKKEEEAGIYLRQERYAGSMRRTFYVGDYMTPIVVYSANHDVTFLFK